LDRKDSNGNYCKLNCRWSTKKEQMVNRRNNRMVSYKGQRMCFSDFAKSVGCLPQSLYNRIAEGWTEEQTVEYYANKQAVRLEG